MLILKRKQGQAIDVGDDVRIILQDIRGGQVKIGILAPKDIRIKRSEISEGIEQENIRAACSHSVTDADLERLMVLRKMVGSDVEVEPGD
jgi:carbon storage regulator